MLPMSDYTEEQRQLLLELLDAGAILIGPIVRERFGLHSPIYIDLREQVYARPELLWAIGREFALAIANLCGRSAMPQYVIGIPDTATPLALATAFYAAQNNLQPPITYGMLRKEAKVYPG